MFQHAAVLRHRGIFSDVREAFWKQEPQIKTVLASLTAPRVFIVPLFISEGYFGDDIIPRELGFCLSNEADSRFVLQGSRTTNYAHPIGTHPRMAEVILARAKEVLERFPFPRVPKLKGTTLFIAGHGTGRNERSREAIERQAHLIRAREIYADVKAVFMEEEPRIHGCLSLAQSRNVVMVPFFASDGLHVVEDIPLMLGEPERIVKQRLAAGQPTWRNPTERDGKLIWYSSAVGTHPAVVEVILERVCECASL